MGNKRLNSGEEEGSHDSKKTKSDSQISINSTVDYNIMDQNSGQGATQQPARITCTSSTCNFYGSAATEGYCSVCFKAELKNRELKLQNSQTAQKVTAGQKTAHELLQSSSNTNTIKESPKQIPESSFGAPKMPISASLQISSSSHNSSSSPSSATPIAINSSNSIKITPNSSSSITSHLLPSNSASIASSAPVPIMPTTPSSYNHTSIVTPNPSSSSKRRNDDSVCSTWSELDGTPGSKKTSSDSPSKPKKKRCGVCKKKLGLTGFPCHCGSMFCPTHRYADQHGCSYDYATEGKKQLAKDNPVVQDDKITRF